MSFSDDTWTLLLYSGHQVQIATYLKEEAVCKPLPTVLPGESAHGTLPLWSSGKDFHREFRGHTVVPEPSVLTP